MNVTFHSEGGIAYFPGLARPTTFDLSVLPPEDAQRLRELIAEVDFFTLPSQSGRQQAPDRRTFHITVEEGGNGHTVLLSEPINDVRLAELVRLLEKLKRSGRGGKP